MILDRKIGLFKISFHIFQIGKTIYETKQGHPINLMSINRIEDVARECEKLCVSKNRQVWIVDDESCLIIICLCIISMPNSSRVILISYNKSRKKSNLLNIELNNPYEIERIISVGKRINYKFDIHDRKPGCIIIPGIIFL